MSLQHLCHDSNRVEKSMSVQETCYFFRLSLEIRLEIYKLALPSNKFYYCTGNDDFRGVDFGLLTTCKATYREAYPILISRNNFRLAYSIRNSLGEPSILLHNLREVTFAWFHICALHQHELESRFNLLIIQGLLKCPKVHTACINMDVGHEDEACRAFESRYREEAVLDKFMRHTGLEALLSIPGISRYEFISYSEGTSKALKALSEYMIAQMLITRSAASYVVPLEEEVIAIAKTVFESTTTTSN